MLECGLLRFRAVFFQNRPMMSHLAALGLAHGADIGLRYLRIRACIRLKPGSTIKGPAHQALHQQLCWRVFTSALIGSSGWAIIAVGPLGQAAGMSYKRPRTIGSLLWDLLIRQKLAQPPAAVA